MVLIASKYGSQDADDSHPYGHQRIETAGTLILSLLLILAGIGIAWDSIIEMIHPSLEAPKGWALPIGIASILINEALFHYTHFMGEKIQSALVTANAWHHRSDAAASLVVSLGIIGSLAGWTYMDPIAAVVVGLLIVKMGLNYGWSSVKELVDSAVAPDITQEIERVIISTDGVRRIHQLRSRMMGNDIFIDVHVLVSPFLSVSEGHFIAQQVHKQLLKQVPKIKDVTVHVDPEDDETSAPCLHLPTRPLLEKKYIQPWCQEHPEIKSWILHYLDGQMTLDLCLDKSFSAWSALRLTIEKSFQNNTEIRKVRLFQKQDEITLAKDKP